MKRFPMFKKRRWEDLISSVLSHSMYRLNTISNKILASYFVQIDSDSKVYTEK